MAAQKFSFRITQGGWAFMALTILLCLGAFNAALNTVYLLASLLAAMALVSVAVPIWNLRGLSCRRALRDDAFALEPFEVHLWLYSKRRTPAYLVSVEEPLGLVPEQRKPPLRRLAFKVAPGGRARLACMLPPRLRGAYPLPGIKWSTRVPFGMAEYGRLSSPGGELLVFPARGRLSRAATSSLKPHGTRVSVPMRTGLSGDEFRSIREYQPGDNPRRIHWKASARFGKLCVRETERERSAPVVILLDARVPLSTPKSDRPATREALELAISFVAETCRVALKQGNAVHLVMSSPKPTVIEVRPGQDDIRGLLEALARLDHSEEETAEALYESAQAAGLRTAWRVVGVTPTPRTATGLRESMGEFIGQLHVASDPGFDTIFRITGGEGGERP